MAEPPSPKDVFLCPVCGLARGPESRPFDDMPPAPWAGHPPPPYGRVYGSSAFHMCPACGFESGYDDDAGANGRNVSFERYLREWLARGASWSRRDLEPPADWDVAATLASIGKGIKATGPEPDDVLLHLPGLRLPVGIWVLRTGSDGWTVASARVAWPGDKARTLVYGDRFRARVMDDGSLEWIERLAAPNQCWTLGPLSRAGRAALQEPLKRVFDTGGFWDMHLRPRYLHLVFPEDATIEQLALVEELRAGAAALAPSAASIEPLLDAEQIAALLDRTSAEDRASFRSDPLDGQAKEGSIGGSQVFAAVHRGQDLGLVWASPADGPGPWATLGGLWVASNERSKGIGSRLLEALIIWARDAGYERLRQEIHPSHHQAITMTSQMGMRGTKRQPPDAPAPLIEGRREFWMEL